MTKRLLIAFLSLYLTMHVSGCTSGGGQEDGEIAESNDGSFSDESGSDFADGSESIDDGGAGDTGTEIAEEAAPIDDGGAPVDDLGGEVAADGGAAPEGDVAAADAPVSDELSLDTAEALPEEAVAAEPAPDAGGDVAANALPPTDEPVFNTPPPAPAPEMSPVQEPVAEAAPAETAPASEATATAESTPAEAAPAAPKTFAPLKKIKKQAFAAADGTSLNRVYLARPGDTMKSVSQKIYGKNRSKDLKAWNGKSSIKTGDKVYYASPNDSADTAMKVFYEDIGIQPSTYTSKDGDNIRAVSKQLLGNSQSWKEVWATNESVESKGDIPAGLEIRYWPEGAEATAVMAKTEAPPPPIASAEPPPPMPTEPAMNDLPPPPPAGTAMNDLPPPPPTSAGTVDTAPPPPSSPPPMESAAPPPPEPKVVAKKPIEHSDSEPEQDQMMWLTAGGIMLLAAAVLYVIIKKNRSKRIDLGQTQV